jgi:hypothetical protein
MILTLLVVFLAMLAAYYFLGTPLLDFIHRFVNDFTHSFPLWVLFRLAPTSRAGAKNPGGTDPTPTPPPTGGGHAR